MHELLNFTTTSKIQQHPPPKQQTPLGVTMASPEIVGALFERLDVLKAQVISGDQDAKKEALGLSRMLTVALNEPANTAVELAFAVSRPMLNSYQFRANCCYSLLSQ
jgi:hypothetical protein